MATQKERRRATRRRLLDTARELFAIEGIEDTSTEAVLEAAGTSRGAMYHHFASRDDLVAAVYEEVAAEAVDRARDRLDRDAAPLERLVAGSLAWLDEASRPEVARILVEDGPAALGWERCRQIEERYSLGAITTELRTAAQAGAMELDSADVTARLLSAALAEAVLVMTHAQDRDRAANRRAVEAVVRSLLSGLATNAPTA
ncbi:TetR/AcrR family transcriptional regulator [Streptomyces bathyalis]|uniref:TetR/AcrR family transcriptional regulator n=1 Tax=Streptomyces bathyalis TaxID=2710756 RepID=A0A7T1WQF2_9ACTN|nr:TetR/AcrR family transcriptional regulator [Streptomyces bathyalis]QPP05229.1 TetR/AcrR family transcriptional regulator [Streptomyces bathyalis]